MPNISHVDALKKKFEDGGIAAAGKHDRHVIKRSPAFRVDRTICGKDVSFVTPKSKPQWERTHSVKEQKVPNGESGKLKSPRVKKFSSEPDIAKNDYSVKIISKETDIMGGGIVTKPPFAEYAVVDKAKKTDTTVPAITKNGADESLELALLSPLPSGPPPKKPPRIFIHNTPVEEPQKDTRLKLEKIENFIKYNEQRGTVIVPRIAPEKQSANNKENESRGLTALSCLTGGCDVVDYSYEKSIGKRSELGEEADYRPAVENGEHVVAELVKRLHDIAPKLGDPEEFSATVPVSMKRSHEPVYALPFRPNGGASEGLGSFKTFGKSGPTPTAMKLTHSALAAKTETPLHYMVTDLDLTKPITVNWQQAADSGKVRTSTSSNSSISHDRKQPESSTKVKTTPPKHEALDVNVNINLDRDVRIIMNQLFGSPITAGLEQDETSGSSSADDDRSLESFHEDLSASSPNLSEDRPQLSRSQRTQRHKVYVRRVSSHVASSTYYTSHRDRLSPNPNSTLFESCLLVGLTLTEAPDGHKKNLPYVKSYFPQHIKPPAGIEFFCFPDADSWPPPRDSQEPEEQCYSIVLTDEKGDRKFGYCRRVLPEGGHFCLPLAYCIISPHRASGFYFKVLQELESRHGSSDQDSFMRLLYDCKFPDPGQNLKLKKILERVTMCAPIEDIMPPTTLVRRPRDKRLEDRDLSILLNHLDIPVFLKVFSSLLLERKVLLLGKSLSTLSGCIEGLQSILYPFSWQHSYVPVLPTQMLDFCEAPTPFVFGVLKQPGSFEASLKERFTEDGIMVDVENSRIIKCCKDEGSILPSKFTKSLRTALTLAMKSYCDNERNILVSEAFVRFFVEIAGHYSRFITIEPDGSKVFEKEQFIKEVQSSSTQSFLEWFTETAMFNVFIQERLQYDTIDKDNTDLFRKRSNDYAGEMEKNSGLLQKNYKGIPKKGKTLGDRIKDLTSFSKS